MKMHLSFAKHFSNIAALDAPAEMGRLHLSDTRLRMGPVGVEFPDVKRGVPGHDPGVGGDNEAGGARGAFGRMEDGEMGVWGVTGVEEMMGRGGGGMGNGRDTPGGGRCSSPGGGNGTCGGFGKTVFSSADDDWAEDTDGWKRMQNIYCIALAYNMCNIYIHIHGSV